VQQPDEYGGRMRLDILLVEDNPGDVVLFKQALRNSAILCSLTVAMDGIQALQILTAQTEPQALYKPNVVFLDLNLPGKRGAEVLAEMKSDAALSAIPVAILTGSDHVDDRAICASLGASVYFTKAVALEDFATLTSEIESFLVTLASRVADPQSLYPTISAA
jgi:two-component system response regulator